MKPVVTTFSKELLLQDVASKHVMVQCTDEIGNPLKLRFHDNTKRKCRSSNINLNKSLKQENVREKMHSNIYDIISIATIKFFVNL